MLRQIFQRRPYCFEKGLQRFDVSAHLVYLSFGNVRISIDRALLYQGT